MVRTAFIRGLPGYFYMTAFSVKLLDSWSVVSNSDPLTSSFRIAGITGVRKCGSLPAEIRDS
jgi:hypothetical protein